MPAAKVSTPRCSPSIALISTRIEQNAKSTPAYAFTRLDLGLSPPLPYIFRKALGTLVCRSVSTKLTARILAIALCRRRGYKLSSEALTLKDRLEATYMIGNQGRTHKSSYQPLMKTVLHSAHRLLHLQPCSRCWNRHDRSTVSHLLAQKRPRDEKLSIIIYTAENTYNSRHDTIQQRYTMKLKDNSRATLIQQFNVGLFPCSYVTTTGARLV